MFVLLHLLCSIAYVHCTAVMQPIAMEFAHSIVYVCLCVRHNLCEPKTAEPIQMSGDTYMGTMVVDLSPRVGTQF